MQVNLKLVGLDSNAFALMNAFAKQARKDGYSQEEIKNVIDECYSGDYNHLLKTLSDNCVNGGA